MPEAINVFQLTLKNARTSTHYLEQAKCYYIKSSTIIIILQSDLII